MGTSRLSSDKTEIKTEYKKKFRPFSQYEYVEGRFKPKREPDAQIIDEMQPAAESWFAEVLELRKKAGEYKVAIHLLTFLTNLLTSLFAQWVI